MFHHRIDGVCDCATLSPGRLNQSLAPAAVRAEPVFRATEQHLGSAIVAPYFRHMTPSDSMELAAPSGPAASVGIAAVAGRVPPASVPVEFVLPAVESKFARLLHPGWPRLRQANQRWLRDTGLMPAGQLDRLHYTDVMAAYYIGAPYDVLEAITALSTWFFCWDDRQDRDAVHGRFEAWRRLHAHVHTAIESPHRYLHDRDPMVVAFAYCLARLYSYLGRSWNARFARHLHAVIEAYDHEFVNRISGAVPTVAEYTRLRRLTFAQQIWTDLLELSAQRELPPAVRRHPAYRRAALLSQEFAARYNDLCSMPKEIAGMESHNLGLSLIRHEGLTLAEAVAEVRRRAQECVTGFLATEPRAVRFAARLADGTARGRELSLSVRMCVFNMRNWFSAVYWFHHESIRYQSPP